jgi:hypothetical protein
MHKTDRPDDAIVEDSVLRKRKVSRGRYSRGEDHRHPHAHTHPNTPCRTHVLHSLIMYSMATPSEVLCSWSGSTREDHARGLLQGKPSMGEGRSARQRPQGHVEKSVDKGDFVRRARQQQNTPHTQAKKTTPHRRGDRSIAEWPRFAAGERPSMGRRAWIKEGEHT